MDKKMLRILKIISFICILVLIVEIICLIYINFFKPSKSIYFDSINSFEIVDDGFLSVGSNNNNENYYEKAKITLYDSASNKAFEKLYNKGYNGAFFGVCEDEDSYIAVGSYESTDEEYEYSVRSALIVKYDKTGEIIYEDTFNVLDDSKFVDVLVLEDGYLVVGQSIYEKMTIGFSTAGGAFLIKYNKSLDVEWQSNFGDSKSAIFNDVMVVDNKIYVTGKDGQNVGVLAKYDMNGELLSSVTYDNTDSLGFTVISSKDESIFVGGSKSSDNDYTSALLVKYDKDLNYQGEVVYGTNANHRFNKLIIDNNGDLVAIGTKANYDKSNDSLSVLNYGGIIGKYNTELKEIKVIEYGEERDSYFTDIEQNDGKYIVSGYSAYEDQSYMGKFIIYSEALKVLEVR